MLNRQIFSLSDLYCNALLFLASAWCYLYCVPWGSDIHDLVPNYLPLVNVNIIQCSQTIVLLSCGAGGVITF